MRETCPHCGTEYGEGELVDIGIGYQQIAPDYPECDCEYIEDMKEKEQNEVSE